MPHLTLMVVSAVAALGVIAVSGLMSLAEVTPNPVSQNWLAAAHSEVEMKTWVFKTAIVIAANILVGHYQVQSIIILIAAGWIVYVNIRYVSRDMWGYQQLGRQGVCCKDARGRGPVIGS
jgi:hypothetical protein